MKTLNNTQLLYIKNDLKSRKPSSGFRLELLDHMCCMVETRLNGGNEFAEAYAKSLIEFSEQGFIVLKPQSPVVIKKRKIAGIQSIAATMLVAILMLVTGADAQEPPEINPLHDGAIITSSFGLRFDPISRTKKEHKGIDLKCSEGTPVKATAAGIIILSKESNIKYGNQIIIKHDDHFETSYAHLKELKVNEGQKVEIGDVIGLSGSTGASTAPHLHYEVIKDGIEVDPSEYFVVNN